MHLRCSHMSRAMLAIASSIISIVPITDCGGCNTRKLVASPGILRRSQHLCRAHLANRLLDELTEL